MKVCRVRVSSKSNITGVLKGRGRFGHRHTTTQGRRPCENKSRDWSNLPVSQGMPKTVGNHQKTEKERNDSFPRAFKDSMALLSL